ncbi:hypothetical protein N7931_04990 [Catenovulum sp. 2E275]|uniref:HvfA family oxazolone/thioamide-modified RiPP metallophore n=1 Tax=Catenovulum sp. 2E275 TaxID=2980497 RepID=UPI0021D0F58A|nr:hypothetical protein [Catenovulum sp. 2E275]MCU4674984.1 hypothetical protein [Catenovulum sp. 2E275]
MKTLNNSKLNLALGAVVLGGLSGTVQAEGFSVEQLSGGYEQLVHQAKADKEAKCGEGKCGAKAEKEAKCGEGKCGAKAEKEAKCGESKCGAKAEKEAKCGEGKCGAK